MGPYLKSLVTVSPEPVENCTVINKSSETFHLQVPFQCHHHLHWHHHRHPHQLCCHLGYFYHCLFLKPFFPVFFLPHIAKKKRKHERFIRGAVGKEDNALNPPLIETFLFLSKPFDISFCNIQKKRRRKSNSVEQLKGWC